MADGAIDVHVDGLRELGTGLTTLAEVLGGTLGAVDSLPIDAVAPVLGPVGADFMSALLTATARHREVLAGVARVLGYPSGSAGEVEETYLRTARRARAVVERVFYA